VNWHRAVDLSSGTSSSYREFVVDLDAMVAASGIAYNSQFRIKVQQYDNYSITTDGFAFDDISVGPGETVATPPPALIALDAYEPDDVRSQAGVILDGQVQVRSIHVAGNLDHATFFLSEASDVVIETDGTAGDTVLFLYDHTGSRVGYDDDGGRAYFSRIQLINLAPGDYCVEVREYGSNGTIQHYTLSLTTALPSAPAIDPVSYGTGDPGDYDLCDSYGYYGCSPQAGGANASGWRGLLAWLLPLAAAVLAVSTLRCRCMRRAEMKKQEPARR
jgi:hypothetical protein